MGNNADAASVAYLSTVPYSVASRLQRRLHAEVADGDRPDTLLLLEHPHVYTLGRRGSESDILASEGRLQQLGVEIHHTDRGGEVTYHGPGQLVAYPIIDLHRWGGGPLKYVRALERTIISTLAESGIRAESEGHPTGVWVRSRKIAAIGVKVGRRVTMHGFALNICPDLSYFDHIVPCGMPGVEVTSVSLEIGRRAPVSEFVPSVVENFGRVFEFQMAEVESDQVLPARSAPVSSTALCSSKSVLS